MLKIGGANNQKRGQLPTNANRKMAGIEEVEGEDEEEDDDDDEEDSMELDSISSFSLQECIDEFRARRVRRVSTQSRETAVDNYTQNTAAAASKDELAGDEDADLINQNRCNKEQERKCKPCENGFCYCFSSSDDATTRDGRVRQSRRSRRSENIQASCATNQHREHIVDTIQQRRHSAPSKLRTKAQKTQHNCCAASISHEAENTSSAKSIKAISSLKSATTSDAPLIHIIQELHDNCVISEVRVNREKIRSIQHKEPQTPSSVSQKSQKPLEMVHNAQCYAPSAPDLNTIGDNVSLQQSSLEYSVKCSKRTKGRHKAAGLLLQRRLSNTQMSFKPQPTQNPPPKPPRSTQSCEGKISVSSLASTTLSVREAEKVLDEFLRKHGVPVPKVSEQHNKRFSHPQWHRDSKPKAVKTIATYPSLSDIERVVESKKGTDYLKNMQRTTNKVAVEKPRKELILGWTDPKITNMLNYDAPTSEYNDCQPHSQIKTKLTHAQPQTIGWQIPPKISLDTVDGGVCQNLAQNIEKKQTPIKTRVFTNKHKGGASADKFIWSDQLRNLSPWSAKKSNLKATSKNFLRQSKNKILRIVSPKKDNKHSHDIERQLRTVGVQTSSVDVCDNGIMSQTPPGSYHSPQQVSGTHSMQTTTESIERPTHFDFTRNVKPPPRTKRGTKARRLNFPLCGAASGICPTRASAANMSNSKTYRSYQADLDQDVNLSRMNYILTNIRNKLEASDNHAEAVFQEVEHRNNPNRFIVTEDDSSDQSLPHRHRQFNRDLAPMQQQQQQQHSEPIYSEIEEDSLHICASPQYDLTAAATATTAVIETPTAPAFDVNALYAQVQKPKTAKVASPLVQHMPLAQLLQDSLKNNSFRRLTPTNCNEKYKSFSPLKSKLNSGSMPLPTAPTPPTPTQPTNTAGSYHSLNNIYEQHSPPKKNRNLSKSDLSLQRSEIFLENLCQSEIVLVERGDVTDFGSQYDSQTAHCTAPQLANAEYTDLSVSYDLPAAEEEEEEEDNNINVNEQSIHSVDSNLGLSILNSPQTQNQSTPKKKSHSPRYTSKLSNLELSQVTPIEHSKSYVESTTSSFALEHNKTSLSAHYKLIKNVLQRSYRKSKKLLKTDKINTSANKESNQTMPCAPRFSPDVETSDCAVSACVDLNELLLNKDKELTTTEQLAHAVSICRLLPDLEISAEMVEAERLLLFTTLTRAPEAKPQQQEQPSCALKTTTTTTTTEQCLRIDAMKLPVRSNATQDMFYNYHYICTFECNGLIKSTQSAECLNGEAIFENCNLEFQTAALATEFEVHCKIFMLRLRKISTLAMDDSLPRQREELKTRKNAAVEFARLQNTLFPIFMNLMVCPILVPNFDQWRRASLTASESSIETLTSRFRLHANFILRAANFKPYQLVACSQDSKDTTDDTNTEICLRAATNCCIPIDIQSKSSNLAAQIELRPRFELRFPAEEYSGFLNVQDTRFLHNWNRRWCTLHGLHFAVWQDETLTQEAPLFAIEFKRNTTLDAAPRDLCARPRSFLIRVDSELIFCAADTQAELNVWLEQLGRAMDFIKNWL